MCIGIPMQITQCFDGTALAKSADGVSAVIDMLLVGNQPENTWVLTFLNTAREVISDQRAAQINNALEALSAISNGESVDHLFADLVGREPELPQWLQQPPKKET